jgi:hypothetical protein
MLADALTKAVNKVELKKFIEDIGMKDDASRYASLKSNQDQDKNMDPRTSRSVVIKGRCWI